MWRINELHSQTHRLTCTILPCLCVIELYVHRSRFRSCSLTSAFCRSCMTEEEKDVSMQHELAQHDGCGARQAAHGHAQLAHVVPFLGLSLPARHCRAPLALWFHVRSTFFLHTPHISHPVFLQNTCCFFCISFLKNNNDNNNNNNAKIIAINHRRCRWSTNCAQRCIVKTCTTYSHSLASQHVFTPSSLVRRIVTEIAYNVTGYSFVVLVSCVKEHKATGVLIEEAIYDFVKEPPKIH